MESDQLMLTDAFSTEVQSPDNFEIQMLDTPRVISPDPPDSPDSPDSPNPPEFIPSESSTNSNSDNKILSNQSMITLLFLFWFVCIVATVLLGYIYIFDIENTTGKTLIAISMIFPIFGQYLVLFLNCLELKIKLKKALLKALDRLIPIIVFSIVGMNNTFDTRNSRIWILFSSRCVQVVLQMTAVCLFSETLGDNQIFFLLYRSLSIIYDIIFFMRFNTEMYQQRKHLIDGVSNSQLNLLDIGTDLLYIITSKFYSPVLLILSVVFLFTGPLFQAILYLKKVIKPSISAFIKVYVSSFLRVHELDIGDQLIILNNENQILKRYFKFCTIIHALAESVPQLTLNIINALLLRLYTPTNILSAVVSFLVVAKATITVFKSLRGKDSITDSKIPHIDFKYCEHLFLELIIVACWLVNLTILNYCQYFFIWIGISIYYTAFLFSLICISLENRYENKGCINKSILYSVQLYIPSSIFKKCKCLMFICYVLFKFGPMSSFLISNAICQGHINPFSTVVLVLIFLELLYKVTYFLSPEESELQIEMTDQAVN